MTGHLCFASPRDDLAALVAEASLLLDRSDAELAPLGEPIAVAYELFRDTCLLASSVPEPDGEGT